MAQRSPERGIHTTVQGAVGLVTLDRPGALNALTTPMLQELADTLDRWETDPEIMLVLLRGAGDRGLSAGGDLRSMHKSALTGGHHAREFFRLEYRVNARIARFPKPFIAIMDGITMGGGIGVSAHGSHRVVTERSVLSMPEVTIGLVPDVGGTWLLSHTPGEFGTYLALCAARFGAADAVTLGLADHFVPSTDLEEAVSEVLRTGSEEPILDAAHALPEAPLLEQRPWIDECFSAEDVQGIIDRLTDKGTPESFSAAQVISGHSPTALVVTLASLRKAKTDSSLEQSLEREFRVSCGCLQHSDLAEGIRARIIDKDNRPRWNPKSIGEVDDDIIDAFFMDQGFGGLGLHPVEDESAFTQ